MPVRSLVSRGLAAAALLVASAAGAQTTVYATDFESGVRGAEWSGAGSVQSAGTMPGFGAWHLRNEGRTATLLSLSGLAAHTTMTLTFDLAMWDYIDYQNSRLRIAVDRTTLYDAAFGNFNTPTGQCVGPGERITADFEYGGFFNGFVPGYGYDIWWDCGRTVSFTFEHSGAAATFSFLFSGGTSATLVPPSFGLDNVTVQTDARADGGGGSVVPEPGTWALLATGLGALGVVARRRRA